MDKMREEFEAWAEWQGYATDKYDESELSDKYKNLAGLYVIPETRFMLEVWKASRAAMCVELPENECGGDGYYYEDGLARGHNDCLELVQSVLDDAGISYK